MPRTIGIGRLAIVDRNSLAGIVRAHEAAKVTGIRLIVGCRLDLTDGMSMLVYPTDRPAYARLCRLLSLGKKRGGKAKCVLEWQDVVDLRGGSDRGPGPRRSRRDLRATAQAARGRVRRPRLHGLDAAPPAERPTADPRLVEHGGAASACRRSRPTTCSSTNRDRRILQDVVTCIRNGTTIDDVGFRRERHADRYLKPPEEMARLFPRYPEAVARTAEIAARCTFSLDELAYQYPEERTMPGLTPQQALEKLTWEGVNERYPEGLPDEVKEKLDHELALIERLGIRAVLPHRELDRPLRAQQGDSVPGTGFCRQLARSATSSASPRSIPNATICCSSGSSPRSAASRPTSTSISSTNAARGHAVGLRDLRPQPCRALLDRDPLPRQGRACGTSARRSG